MPIFIPSTLMKYFAGILALLFALPFLAHSQNEMLDADNGILGFQLGAHRDSVPIHLEKRGKVQKLNKYEPYADSLDYNGIPLHSVYCYYWDAHLHSIEIKTKGENTTTMLALLEALYGEGKEQANFSSQLYWQGEKCRLFFEQNLVTKDGLWTWVSDKVHKEYELAMYNLKYHD